MRAMRGSPEGRFNLSPAFFRLMGKHHPYSPEKLPFSLMKKSISNSSTLKPYQQLGNCHDTTGFAKNTFEQRACENISRLYEHILKLGYASVDIALYGH